MKKFIKLVIRELFQRANELGGRTTRKDFWLSYLGGLIIAFLIGVISAIPVIGLVSFILWIWFIIGLVAMIVRRTIDAGVPAWVVIFMFIPFIGVILFVIVTLRPSCDNKYNYKYRYFNNFRNDYRNDNNYNYNYENNYENSYENKSVKREIECPKCKSTNLMIGNGYFMCEDCGKKFHITR